MPKDADFNCGVNDGRTDVEQYADSTKGANGAVDFWGNVWEWTSTARSASDGATLLGVKGGSWSSARTNCRTEYRKEARNAAERYEDVGFRVVQVLGGNEPKQMIVIAYYDINGTLTEVSIRGIPDFISGEVYNLSDDTNNVKCRVYILK